MVFESIKSKLRKVGGILGRVIDKGMTYAPKIGGVLNRVGGAVGGSIGGAMQTVGGVLNKIPKGYEWLKKKFAKRKSQIVDAVNQFKNTAENDAQKAKTAVENEKLKISDSVKNAMNNPSINVGIEGAE